MNADGTAVTQVAPGRRRGEPWWACSGVVRSWAGRWLGAAIADSASVETMPEPRSRTFASGANLVVIGSFGGSDLPPAWWLNLQRDPQASVLIGGTTQKGKGEGRDRRGARPALAPRDDDPPWVRP